MHNKKQKFLSTLLTVMLVATTAVFIAKAQTGTTLSIQPQSIIDDTIAPGATFKINLTVADVTDLYGWQAKILFDNTVLECTSTGTQLPSNHVFTGMSYQSPAPDIRNADGYVFVMAILMSGPGVNVTQGLLYQIQFSVIGRGLSDLSFDKINKTGGTYMIRTDGIRIAFTPEEGLFDNRLPAGPATLYIDPSRIVDPTIVPCHNITVNITIADATDLYEWKLALYYKNDILNATEITEGPFLQGGGTTSFQAEIQNNFNATHGSINANATLLGATGVTGNGTLATVTFHVINLGNTTIALNQTELYNSLHEPHPHSTSDGYFNNVLMAKLHVIPPELIDPSLMPPATFNITVAVDDVENMYGYEFNLTYDANVLTCTGVIINAPLNETHFDSYFSVDNAIGAVWVKVDYYPPANPITTYTNITLVTIFFRVDSMGCTILHLSNTHITNPEDQPINHETTDGFFCTLIRDLAVTNVVPSTNIVYEGWIIHINVTVKNEGNMTETFDVKAYYGVDNLIGTLTVENLDPDNESTLNFTWNTEGVTPCHNYTIWAEAVAVPYEIDTTDNTCEDGGVKVRLMGDVNGDGMVEMLDFNVLSQAYGSYPGHPRWNPLCDLNQDEWIEMLDFLWVSRNFGISC